MARAKDVGRPVEHYGHVLSDALDDLSAATFEVDALEVFICDGGCRVHSGAGTGTQLVTLTDNALPV